MAKILVVENDSAVSAEICRCVRLDGHAVKLVENESEAQRVLINGNFDIFVIGWREIGLPGIELVRALRRDGQWQPVIMISDYGDLKGMEEAFNAGADDYLMRPFYLREFVIRLKALLRRSPTKYGFQSCSAGAMNFEGNESRVLIDGQVLDLLPREVSILACLWHRAGTYVPSDTIIDQCWSANDETSRNALRTVMSRLRKKIRQATGIVMIESLRGLGYRIIVPAMLGPMPQRLESTFFGAGNTWSGAVR